ncbi:hypothetical protein JOE44_002168 [Chryseobacterium sp. PvR013]|uniref:hypothetical protein n=1 Tax=Chryseobacterium sp. PvR013 TaxID=2806595 RepID=UPI001AE89D2E|nr:hypothetical protein [Chryseobacterium sp. PvR013]MBP1165284.1 hypothetical protein [Chryseobacterium sp. PvR013]
MKKVFFLSAVAFISFLNSCNSDDSFDNGNNANNQKELTIKNKNLSQRSESDIVKLLENKYKIAINSDVAIDEQNIKSLDESLINAIEYNGYKFLINNKETYAIPFKDNQQKFLLSNFNDLQIIFENYVDENGNGKIIITSDEEIVTKLFESGKLVKVDIIEKDQKNSNMSARKSKFRVCFDQAYDDICDGPIGCTAWYTSPLPALTAIAYCTATT